MADTLTISLDPHVIERLRRLAEATGEPLEDLARGVLEDTVAEFDGAMGDDAELQRRIAVRKHDRMGVPASEVHAWLRQLATDPNAPAPAPKRIP